MKLTSQMISDPRWYEIIVSKSGSSQLTDEDRILFIKEICNENVYLAALCKANSLGDAYMCLDDIISAKAVDIISHSKMVAISAEAFHALAVINQYETISTLLNTNRLSFELYKGIIKIIIRNADENQIVELLNILLKYDKDLFIIALEQLSILDFVFSQDAQNRIIEITQQIFESSLDLLKIKTIASLKFKIPNIDVLKLITTAIDENLIKQAINIVYIYNFHQFFNPLDYINKIFNNDKANNILCFFEYLNSRNIVYDMNWLYKLMANPNYTVKNLAIQLMEKRLSSKEHLACINKFININISLNIYSSLNYASFLIGKYAISNANLLIKIIDNLILLSSSTSLILAHRLIEENKIIDITKIIKIANLLFQKDDSAAIKESFSIYNKVYKSYNDKILEAAIKLKNSNAKYHKLAYDLVVMYLEPTYKIDDVIVGKTYYALNLFYKKTDTNKGFIIKLAGIPNLIHVPIKNNLFLCKNTIIKVKVVNILDEKIKVEIIDYNIENRMKINQKKDKYISGFGELLLQELTKK